MNTVHVKNVIARKMSSIDRQVISLGEEIARLDKEKAALNDAYQAIRGAENQVGRLGDLGEWEGARPGVGEKVEVTCQPPARVDAPGWEEAVDARKAASDPVPVSATARRKEASHLPAQRVEAGVWGGGNWNGKSVLFEVPQFLRRYL
ncbi:MAG: hypothetical protein ACE5JX_21625 [Acidobacteriota bacterium]